MEKEFIPYEQALVLRELGFNEETICVYNSYKQLKGGITSSIDGDYIKRDKWEDRLRAPLYQQAFRWFREEHNIDKTIITHYNTLGKKFYRVGIIFVKDNLIESLFIRPTPNDFAFIEYKTYEEAELACLNKLIEIIKERK